MLAAARAMETYFPDWCRDFPVKLCGGSYFTGNLIHWTVLSDPDGIEAMKPEEIIRYVLGRRSFDKMAQIDPIEQRLIEKAEDTAAHHDQDQQIDRLDMIKPCLKSQ